jgi:Ca-activated chloride channel homolog
MKKYVNILGFLTIFTILLTGCNENQQQDHEPEGKAEQVSEENDAKKEEQANELKEEKGKEAEIQVEPLPTTYEELAAKEMGEHHDFYFSLNDEEIKGMFEIFSNLPAISNNPSEEDLDYFYQELLSRVQEDFEGPEKAIREMKFQAIGDPEIEDTRYQFKENLNVEILLDASGSMAGTVDGKVKMEAAKGAILEFVESLPEQAKVGIRVYGHKGTNSNQDRALSCGSSEIVFPISNYEEASFKEALNRFNPSGWTPIGLALNEAQKDLAKFDGANNTNIVYLVSDGISTCDEDPIKAAKALYSSNISPIINVIGFDVDSEGQNQLKDIANATEGLYTHVSDGNQLSKELSKVTDLAKTWEEWKTKGTQSLELKKVKNNIDIFVYTTEESSKATDEKTRIDLILSQFWQNDLMSKESFKYLQEKNNQYHQWIRDEVERFDEELKALNEKNYTEALQILEEKYEQNTQ